LHFIVSKLSQDIVPVKPSQSGGGRGARDGGGRGSRGGRNAPSGRGGGRGDRERERPNRPSTAIRAPDASNNIPATTTSSGSSFAWGNSWSGTTEEPGEAEPTASVIEQSKPVVAAPAHVSAPVATPSVTVGGGWSSGLTLAERLKRKAEEVSFINLSSVACTHWRCALSRVPECLSL